MLESEDPSYLRQVCHDGGRGEDQGPDARAQTQEMDTYSSFLSSLFGKQDASPGLEIFRERCKDAESVGSRGRQRQVALALLGIR